MPEAVAQAVLASIGVYVLAAVAEIAGCFVFWAWLRRDASAWWLLPGLLSLALFAYLLTRVEVDVAGRVYAAYGGIYILASMAWLWMVEAVRPTGWDLAGVAMAVMGTCIILVGATATR